ncbi:flagellin D [Clostridia bacterium]|nr:flagellin D [Clostridia bacterium]
MRIQNNIVAVNTHRQLGINQAAQAKATEKLSSGFRINRAGDDAAGLSISEKMRAQIRGLNRASSNAQDGISMIQAAEGALQETHSILQRIRELAVQGANDVNGADDRAAIDSEINQLGVELDRIASTTNFNGKYVLSGAFEADTDKYDNAFADGTAAWVAGDNELQAYTGMTDVYGPLNLQVGANTQASDVIQLSFHGVGAKDLLGDVWSDIEEYASRIAPSEQEVAFRPGEADDGNAAVMDASGNTNLIDSSDVYEVSTGGYQALINMIDGKAVDGQPTDADTKKTGIALVSDLRSQLGAVQNRLEHTVSNLDTVAENMQSAESRIRDVDMAKEMMNFTKQNVLNQAATAMLAQANQLPQNVLSLIR